MPTPRIPRTKDSIAAVLLQVKVPVTLKEKLEAVSEKTYEKMSVICRRILHRGVDEELALLKKPRVGSK